MNTKEKLKKFAKENEGLLLGALLFGCVAGRIGISVWEQKHLKTVSMKEWKKYTGQSTFDELLDKKIIGAFATVEYEDGTIGIISNVLDVAEKLIEQSPQEV